MLIWSALLLHRAEAGRVAFHRPLRGTGSALMRQLTVPDPVSADQVAATARRLQFDLVICQFGVMFFSDRPAAFAQMRRVLAPGGRLLFSTWGAVETHGFAAALVAALAHAFPDDPPTFIAAVPHGYCDLGRVAADLAAGGLNCVSAEPVTLEGRADSAAEWRHHLHDPRDTRPA
jgi:SAM-dependent methyltransferase